MAGRNTYQIKASNGGIYEVQANDDAQAARLEKYINRRIAAGDPDLKQGRAPDRAIIRDRESAPAQSPAQQLKTKQDQSAGPAGYKDLIMQGVTFGLADEASGAVNALMSPFTPGAYEAGRDATRMRVEDARNNTGWTGTAAEIGGGLLGAAPRIGGQALLTAGSAIKRAATGGAIGGGVAGFGSGEGTIDSLIKAGVGATVGGALGTAVPVVANVAANRIGGVNRLVGRDTGQLARQLVGEAINADASTPAMVGNRLITAAQRGTPLAIADTGENARGLLASVSRQPGPSRVIARDAVGQRQVEQGDRVLGAIGRDLGPIANVRQQSDNLMQQARTAAAPLYESAYKNAVIATPELEAVLNTPAGRGALARARTIAANERRDPEALGFMLDADGNVRLDPTVNLGEAADGTLEATQGAAMSRGYTPQTLDYVKRGLDDIIESHRDPVTGRLVLDEAGRAINAVRSQLLGEVDRLNPDYAGARAAYAGPASAEEAMQLGRQSLTASAEDIEAATGRMTEPQREQFALGFRAAMADNLGRAVDGADKVGRLLGTPRKRAALASVFGGNENFDNFLATMTDERATSETFRSVMAGSQTAERLAADARSTDAGLVDTAAGAALRGVSEPIGLLGDALKSLREVGKFGAGKAGDETRESVASLLTETDPALLKEIARAIKVATVRQRRQERLINRTSGKLGAGVGVNTGLAIGQALPQ